MKFSIHTKKNEQKLNELKKREDFDYITDFVVVVFIFLYGTSILINEWFNKINFLLLVLKKKEETPLHHRVDDGIKIYFSTWE